MLKGDFMRIFLGNDTQLWKCKIILVILIIVWYFLNTILHLQVYKMPKKQVKIQNLDENGMKPKFSFVFLCFCIYRNHCEKNTGIESGMMKVTKDSFSSIVST